MKYEIGGKTYIQKPLVLGQIGELVEALYGIVIPQPLTVTAIVGIMGDRLNRAIAIVVREEGKLLKEKDVDAMTAELDENIDALTQMQVIEDFFDCNPIPSLLEKIPEAVGKITEKMPNQAVEQAG